ncbi:CDP-alcohol phosphatidyltransferase family protein [Jatrophihabitans sp.]|uniref:CDP-alcohol phosphatidyltransferase family protein n=1 Tax=Jatrophihabitans sp. TaxID=1932789 RepID=UPI002D1AE045|nr:CDP-alcohol phosphatidyltransferase family protein [Jatrophihabitans sp.]
MYPVHAGPAIGLSALLALLAALAATTGLGPVGWLAGAGCAVAGGAVLVRAMARRGIARFGPADRVTLTRAVLTGGVAALVADSVTHPVSAPVLVSLAATALVLDCIDGWLARRTGTASEFGARFDLEVDAFLIGVLSCFVARSLGPEVLLIGLARYAFVAAGWWLAWLHEPVPPRYWRKVVAAVQGVVLTVVASGIPPRPVSLAAVAVALALLVESFGGEAWEKWRRHCEPVEVPAAPLDTPARAA